MWAKVNISFKLFHSFRGCCAPDLCHPDTMHELSLRTSLSSCRQASSIIRVSFYFFLSLKGRILILDPMLSAVSLSHSHPFPLLLQKTTKPSPPCCSHCKTTAGSILPIALNTSDSPCIQGIYNLPNLFHLTRCKPHLFGLSAAPALPTIAACVEECGLTFFLMCKIWKSLLLDVNCKKHRFAFFQLSPLICLTTVIAMCRSMPKEYAKKEYWLPHYSRVVR